MCEVLAVSADRGVNVRLSWRGFTPRGARNPHGWGYGYQDGGKFTVERFARQLKATDPKVAAPREVGSPAFVAHVFSGGFSGIHFRRFGRSTREQSWRGLAGEIVTQGRVDRLDRDQGRTGSIWVVVLDRLARLDQRAAAGKRSGARDREPPRRAVGAGGAEAAGWHVAG